MFIKHRIEQILSNDINKRILNSSVWILLGNVISKFTLLLATLLMTKYMGKEEYGQFGIIKSTILMFAMFAGLELGMTATKYISQYRETDKRKIEKIVGVSNLFAIAISLLVLGFVYFFSMEIAALINAPKLYKEIKVSSFILFFSSLNGVQGGILAGMERFKEISINNTLAGIFSSILLVVSAKYFSLQSVIIAFGINYLLLFIFNYFTLRKVFYSQFKINIFQKENFEEVDVLWKFSLPAILAGIMVGPVIWLCNYFLVNQPKGYLEMADFDIANQWRNTILFIPSALAQIVLPLLASSVEDKDNYRKIYSKNLKINFYLGFSLVFLFVLISPIIIDFYGENYEGALIPMIIMFITTGFITVNNVIGQVIASKDKMWIGFYVNLLWGIILLISCYILVVIYQFGAIGMSISFLISYQLHTLIQFLYIKNKI